MKDEIHAMVALAEEKLRAARLLLEFTTILTRLFEDRQSGDYDVIGGVTESEARTDVDDAQRLVAVIRDVLSQ